MRTVILLFCMISVSLSDEVTLKTGFTVRGITILEIDHSVLTYRLQDSSIVRIPLRNIDNIIQSPAGIQPRIHLRNGTLLDGEIMTLDHRTAGVITAQGDTVVIEASEALRIEGPSPALSFRTSDGRYMFLTRRNVRFIGGRPAAQPGDPHYRVLVSASAAIPAASNSFSLPGLIQETPRTGYSVAFSVEYAVNTRHSLSCSYRYIENGLSGPDSVGASVTDWSGHLLMGGLKRYFSATALGTFSAEVQLGYLYSMPPEFRYLTSEPTSGTVFCFGAGYYLTDHVSFCLSYVTASPSVTMTYSPISRSSTRHTSDQRFTYFLAGLSYTLGSDGE